MNDQNRRLSEYVEVWKKEKDNLEARLAQQDQRISEILLINAGQLLGLAVTESVFEELYKVKWYLESARESLIAVPPWGNERYVARRLYLYGVYGMLGACGGLLLVFLALWLTIIGHKRNSSEKT